MLLQQRWNFDRPKKTCDIINLGFQDIAGYLFIQDHIKHSISNTNTPTPHALINAFNSNWGTTIYCARSVKRYWTKKWWLLLWRWNSNIFQYRYTIHKNFELLELIHTLSSLPVFGLLRIPVFDQTTFVFPDHSFQLEMEGFETTEGSRFMGQYWKSFRVLHQ